MAGKPLVPELPLFEEERDKALRIFNRLRLPDVIGQPSMSEAAGDWIRGIVATLFGSYDAAANRRMVQEAFIAIPKKNGKSSYSAAIMVTAMLVNRRPNAEFLLIAPTKEIANISFSQAAGIIKADPELAKVFFPPQPHLRLIKHRTSGASLQVKAADTDAITGSKSTGILVDETHVFAKKSNADQIFVEVRGALAARPDGFMIQITTQSKEPPAGIFKSELAIARSVRDGLIKLPRLAVLYELPHDVAKDGGWKNPAYWPLVNPNLGRSVDRTFLENELLVAEEKGPEAMALFASQHFNVEVGLALRNDRWIGTDYWPNAADPEGLTLDSLIERSEVAVVGVDGGGLDDLLGVAVIGRCRVTRDWLLWTRAWAQSDVFERRKEIASRLEDFIKDGDLVRCTNPTQDVREVADVVERLSEAGLLPEKHGVGFDPQGVAAMVDELAARGIGDEQVVGVSQGFRLSSAVWGAERKLKDGTLWHSGSEMMAWCVGNAKAEQRGNAVLITKQTAGKAKIDPLIAAFNAVTLMSRNPDPKTAVDVATMIA